MELIAVIILLSILGVFAMGRMVSPTMYAPAVVSEAVLAQVRAAQQIAVARHDAVVTLTVDRSGDDWRLQITSDVDGVLRTERVGAENTALNAVSGAASGNIDAATPLTVSFDHGGDLETVTIGGVAGAPASGVAVSVSGDTSRQLCIYPSGYANADVCG